MELLQMFQLQLEQPEKLKTGNSVAETTKFKSRLRSKSSLMKDKRLLPFLALFVRVEACAKFGRRMRAQLGGQSWRPRQDYLWWLLWKKQNWN